MMSEELPNVFMSERLIDIQKTPDDWHRIEYVPKSKLDIAIAALEFYAGDEHSDIELDIFDYILKINTTDKNAYVEEFDSKRLCKVAREALKELGEKCGD